jgi:hypothetical protein
MTDPIEREQSWSFVTLLRIRPILKRPGRGVIQYRITDGKSDEYAQTFKVLELEIPEGADPGLVHNNKSGFIRFTFNDVFDEDSSQEDIFERIQSMVLDIFEGVNSTVFAYGQTGSGNIRFFFNKRNLSITQGKRIVCVEVSPIRSEGSSQELLD